MKVPKAQVAAHRERIIDTALQLFRAHGFDGVGVAELMKQAGLTHGGFYGHFASKEALAAECCSTGLARMADKWRRVPQRHPQAPLAAMMRRYLTLQHRDDPGNGCPLPALAVDVARQSPAVRHAFTAALRPFIDLLSDWQPAGDADGEDNPDAVRRRRALATLAAMVGAMVLARAVDDDGLAAEILDATARTHAPVAAAAATTDAAAAMAPPDS